MNKWLVGAHFVLNENICRIIRVEDGLLGTSGGPIKAEKYVYENYELLTEETRAKYL